MLPTVDQTAEASSKINKSPSIRQKSSQMRLLCFQQCRKDATVLTAIPSVGAAEPHRAARDIPEDATPPCNPLRSIACACPERPEVLEGTALKCHVVRRYHLNVTWSRDVDVVEAAAGVTMCFIGDTVGTLVAGSGLLLDKAFGLHWT